MDQIFYLTKAKKMDDQATDASSLEANYHTILAIHELERRGAEAHEAGHDKAAKVLIRTASLLRATVPFPIPTRQM
ncbi:hypothetical protein GWK16_14510 [Roseomonas sp. JC162]|uniref:Uncharacterized protein n=1 Tax=Neoroseomonas marina TaxID=1232220 RepID=A0A848EG78_9PROT|nr:hypothetical protein [Neoroseomonas marina]NMJ42457.1 hypothetical protein [Neoroseomonas marina]